MLFRSLVFLKRNTFIRKVFKRPKTAYYYQRFFRDNEVRELLQSYGFEIEKIMPVDHIFSLVEFSSIFRDRNTYDGETRMAVKLGGLLEKILPWQTAGSILAIEIGRASCRERV